jgi:hypothetical protein
MSSITNETSQVLKKPGDLQQRQMTALFFAATWPMKQCKNEASRLSGNWMGGRAPRTEMNRDALLRRIFSSEGSAYTGTRQSQEGKGRVRQYTHSNATASQGYENNTAVQLHQTPQLINKASHIYSERNSSSRSLIRP